MQAFRRSFFLLSAITWAGCAQIQPTHWTGEHAGLAPAVNPLNSAVLWMQTSAEHDALCLQVYKQATEVVTAAAKAADVHGKKSAVIMDLDETVFDGGWFEDDLIRHGTGDYDPALWHDYVFNHNDKVRLVPGAAEFIKACGDAGVSVYYVTNRDEDQREPTMKTLERLGLGTSDLRDPQSLRLQMKPPGQKNNNKGPRFDLVAARCNVLANVGDNLGDLSSEFDHSDTMNTIQARKDKMREHYADFGTRWFVLPNPAYGEWEKFTDKKNPLPYLYP